MAQKKIVLTTYVDDLTGEELEADNVHTVSFGWAGSQYEIDLGKSGADKLEKLIKPYVDSARRVSGGRGRTKGSGSRASTSSGRSADQLAAIREWAKKNGYEVADRGRVKADIVSAFDKAHAS